MRFMGIPLDGTINSFQSKLATKGITPDVQFNKQSDPGVRGFNGSFAGHKAEIYVYYDAKTSIVYRAKACINSESKTIAEQTYSTIKSQLQDKYSNNCFIETDTHEGYESTNFLLLFGMIDLYCSSHTEVYPTIYTLHIDYYDIANFNEYNNSVKEDL